MDDDIFLDTKATGELLGISTSKLTKMRVSGDGPPYYQPDGVRRVLYRKSEALAWMGSSRRRSTSPMAAVEKFKPEGGRHG